MTLLKTLAIAAAGLVLSFGAAQAAVCAMPVRAMDVTVRSAAFFSNFMRYSPFCVGTTSAMRIRGRLVMSERRHST